MPEAAIFRQETHWLGFFVTRWLKACYAGIVGPYPCMHSPSYRLRACDMLVMGLRYAGYGRAICWLWARNRLVMALPFAGYGTGAGGKRAFRAVRWPVRYGFSGRWACCNSFFRRGMKC